ncbi:DMT family transporter [Planctobacterium marinum]|uniref:EamA domain-containing protein n=1 Tax=Planctobacterium marinum TaxID=1631968 RepID=A0AA48HUY1_9ALTE|nr:hypothetical protein MACH26_05710 [Planctobacterium marinum]
MSNGLLFCLCAFIWGTTWFAITFQHSEMSLIYSVGMRFCCAALLLGVWCFWHKLNMKFSWRAHVKMLGAGFSLYTLDYVFLYLSQQFIVSALLAVFSASVVYFTIFLRRFMLGKPVRMEVVIGAAISAVGLYLLFSPEMEGLTESKGLTLGLIFATISFFFAAVGNVISENALSEEVPVVQFNFWAMSYSLLFTFGYALYTDEPFVLPEASSYWLTLAYLAVFGSVLAFGAYMKLVKNLGADKSSNVILVCPVVALVISTLFENYQWSIMGLTGVVAILIGNAIAMDKLKFKKRTGPVHSQ